MASNCRLAQDRDQCIGLLDVTVAMLVQLGLRLVVHLLDETHKHVCNIIERLSRLPSEQRCDKGNPFRFAHAEKIGCVEREGFGGELMDFLIGNVGEDSIDSLRAQPGQMPEELA